ncbi:MAG: S8 family serine peptidase [Chloroflexi bacterium]|nr:S8 family serine peptidase [Chloroflexota bacterium]
MGPLGEQRVTGLGLRTFDYRLVTVKQDSRALGTSFGSLVCLTSSRALRAVILAPVVVLLAIGSDTRLSLPAIPQAVTSEGVSRVGADAWHNAGFRGDGVKVAVVDEGFGGWRQRQEEGNLPSTVITRTFRADGAFESSEHGTAAAEVVHDIVPNARLYLVTYYDEAELGNAVDWLIGQGVQIISFSLGYFNSAGPADGSGTVNEIVARARNAGILWVTAAGDQARRHWEGAFNDPDGNGYHNLTGSAERNYVSLDPAGRQGARQLYAVLSWDDWPASSLDFGLLLFRSGTSLPVHSGARGAGGAPFVWLYYSPTLAGLYELAIRKGDDDVITRTVHLELYTRDNDLSYSSAPSSLMIPADSPNALTVGAVSHDGDSIEPFSSQGPTDSPFPSYPPPRTKPDIVAPDNVSTATYGPGLFSGTSAAAAHVAGAAALVLSKYPSYTPAQVQGYLEAQAEDLGLRGKDNQSGAGMLQLDSPPTLRVALPVVINSYVAGW